MAERQYQIAPGVFINETTDDEYQVAPGVFVNETAAAAPISDIVILRRRMEAA